MCSSGKADDYHHGTRTAVHLRQGSTQLCVFQARRGVANLSTLRKPGVRGKHPRSACGRAAAPAGAARAVEPDSRFVPDYTLVTPASHPGLRRPSRDGQQSSRAPPPSSSVCVCAWRSGGARRTRVRALARQPSSQPPASSARAKGVATAAEAASRAGRSAAESRALNRWATLLNRGLSCTNAPLGRNSTAARRREGGARQSAATQSQNNQNED